MPTVMRAVANLDVRLALCALVVAPLAGGCHRTRVPQETAPSAAARSSPPRVDSALARELIRMGEEDQAGRGDLARAVTRGDTAVLRRFMAGDSVRTTRLQRIVAEHGWPTRSLAGPEAAMAAWLLLQHSPDNAWQARMLPSLERAAAAHEIRPQDLAMLTDRVLVHSGKPQRYGNSFSVRDGRLVPDPIERLDGLDARRAAVGLPPMAEYARVLGEMNGLPVDWPPPPPPR